MILKRGIRLLCESVTFFRNTNSHPLAPSQLYLANNVTLMTACTGFSYCSEMMWEQYVQRLRETSRAAVQASQAKSSFLAVMSHEVLSRRVRS
jgi:hypothetical protein